MLRPDSFVKDAKETDYVGLIYEWESKTAQTVPLFKYFDGSVDRHWYFKESGVIYRDPEGTYNLNHSNHACQIKLSNDLIFESYGTSRNEARKEACRAAYEYLEKKGMLRNIFNEIKNPNFDDSINQLEILARRNYFSMPVFEYDEAHDQDGNPVWNVRCNIKDIDRSFVASDSSKKRAKKQAAFLMLKYVLGKGRTER